MDVWVKWADFSNSLLHLLQCNLQVHKAASVTTYTYRKPIPKHCYKAYPELFRKHFVQSSPIHRPTDKPPQHVNTLLHILSHSSNSPACEHHSCTASSTASTPNSFQCVGFFLQPETFWKIHSNAQEGYMLALGNVAMNSQTALT